MVLYIFKADTLSPDIQELKGDYGELYTACLRAAGYTGETKVLDVENGEYPTGELTPNDAILISGSKKNAWDRQIPWIQALVAYISQSIGKVPLVGVCFGHQIIARALGASMGPSEKGWETSGLPVKPTPFAQKLLPALGQNPVFMHMHKDQVFELPEQTELLFSSEITPIQGFYRKDSILSVQFHPEFDQEIVALICNSRFVGEHLNDTLERSRAPNSGHEYMKYVVKFLKGELRGE